MLNNTFSEDGLVQLIFKNRAFNLSQFVLPPLNLSNLFDSNKFNSNFFQAFGEDFPKQLAHQQMFSLEIQIQNDLPFSKLEYLSKNEESAFRFIVCMVFGLIFSLKLPICSCYPQNIAEYSAVRAGIGLNCINLDCKNSIKLDPLKYDDLIHSNDCSDLNIQAAFVSMSVFAGGNVSTNVNINQATRELACLENPLDVFPLGTIISLKQDLPPAGFALCNGQSVPKDSKIKLKRVPDFRFIEERLGFRFFMKVY